MRDVDLPEIWKSLSLLTPLSITATPIPVPSQPWLHAMLAFTASAVLLRSEVSGRSCEMYKTLGFLERCSNLFSGTEYRPPSIKPSSALKTPPT